MKRRFGPDTRSGSLLDNLILLALFFILIFLSYRFGQYITVVQHQQQLPNNNNPQNSIHSNTDNSGVDVLSLVDDDPDMVWIDPNEQWIETVSWKPRVSVFHNILTGEECDRIVELVGGEVKRAGVLEFEGTWVEDRFKEDAVLDKLAKKIAEWSQVPMDHGENFYLWKFKMGDAYPPHRDTIVNPENIGGSGERIASVFVYLSTPTEGGELIFPETEPQLTILPKKGNAVLLWNLRPNGEVDELSTHATQEITAGIKWTLTKWIRQKKFP